MKVFKVKAYTLFGKRYVGFNVISAANAAAARAKAAALYAASLSLTFKVDQL